MAASNLGIRVQGPLFEQSIINSGMDINFNVFWTCNRNKDLVNWSFVQHVDRVVNEKAK
jgi:hypothetical protein